MATSGKTMFSGECLTTIDAKGRTSIPAKFREILTNTFGDERFVITKSSPVDFDDGGFGRGISVYPLKEWLEVERRIHANDSALPLAQLNVLKRLVLGPAQECCPDKLGRVLIPPPLRIHAGLEKICFLSAWANGLISGQRRPTPASTARMNATFHMIRQPWPP